jgi:hypothetical protein
MIYTVNLRQLSFKQNLSSLITLLNDQQATYAILRYAQEVPERIYNSAMIKLAQNIDQITYKKLLKLVNSYISARRVGIIMDEEFVETIEVPVNVEIEMTYNPDYTNDSEEIMLNVNI